MRPDRRVLGLVLGGSALILAAALTLWFLANFEQRTTTVPVGLAPEARRNPLLAAERFLNRIGREVEAVPGRGLLRRLPGPADTLVVRGLGPLSGSHGAALQRWIESGGHLVVEAMERWDPETTGDDWLATQGVGVVETWQSTDEDAPEAATDQGRVLARWSPPGSAGGALVLAFEGEWALHSEREPLWSIDAAGQPRALSLGLGDGRLTVLSDSELFTNGAVGDHDHALFLAWLTAGGPDGRVWLLYDSRVPWLGAILWRAAPLALVSLAVLLLIWLWSGGRRLGPLETVAEGGRQDILEHLDASAGFLWRHGGATALAVATRRRVGKAWERRRPELRGLVPVERNRRLGALAGEAPETVAEALDGQPDNPRDYASQARQLQRLWSAARPPVRDHATPVGAASSREDAATQRPSDTRKLTPENAEERFTNNLHNRVD